MSKSKNPKITRYGDTVKINSTMYQIRDEVSKRSCEGCAFINQYCAKDITNICTNEHVIFTRIKPNKKK